MATKIKDLPVTTQEERDRKAALSGRASAVGLNENSTAEEVTAEENRR